MLDPVTQSFVLHFGEMGSRWGINRTVGQMYALMYISEEPLCADDIASSLGFSRSNVSMGIKELQSWNLIRMVHRQGDRRDYFTTPDDVWDIARALVKERRKRELEPTLTFMRETLMEHESESKDSHAIKRIEEMNELLELVVTWTQDLEKLNRSSLDSLLRMGSGVRKVLEFKDKLTGS